MARIVDDFRTFVSRGNVLDLAVGIVIGAAFTTVVKSFVDDILMPPIGMATGGVDFADLYVNLSGGRYASLEEAKAAGAATVNYGVFLNNVIAFLIVALAVFLIVQAYNRMRVDTDAGPRRAHRQGVPLLPLQGAPGREPLRPLHLRAGSRRRAGVDSPTLRRKAPPPGDPVGGAFSRTPYCRSLSHSRTFG
jgi:large conductance mechanosensitive channel